MVKDRIIRDNTKRKTTEEFLGDSLNTVSCFDVINNYSKS